ncbi:MAG: hypothetical protein WAX69_16440 [Victivallales bacterium]
MEKSKMDIDSKSIFAKESTLRGRWAVASVLSMLLVAALPLGLPVIGAVSVGRPLDYYLEFPPLTSYVRHETFSWSVFSSLAVLLVAVISPFLKKIISSVNRTCFTGPFLVRPFPGWGWVAVISCVIFWTLAWNRFEWFSFFQPYTFSPIWISYIFIINALTFARSGNCMLKDRTSYFILLFPLSSLFWWFFEYLNRFVQNWHYIGAEPFSSAEYAIFATLCFSTVLPAVLSTYELLETFSNCMSSLDNFVKVRFVNTRSAAWTILLLACLGLAGIGRYPDYLFPIIWLSPFLIITSLQTIRGEENIFIEICEGRWRRIVLLALAALICGFFWEMWNFYSLPKWAYSVPFVDRFRIFEMPLLGYAGYLPFGMECAVIGGLLNGFMSSMKKPHRNSDPCIPKDKIKILISATALIFPVLFLYHSWDAGIAPITCLFSGEAFNTERPLVIGGALDQPCLQKEFFIFCYFIIVICPFLIFIRWFNSNEPRVRRLIYRIISLIILVHPLSILIIFTYDVSHYTLQMGFTPMRLTGLIVATASFLMVILFTMWVCTFKFTIKQ